METLTFGAIATALIAAYVSLLGLVLAKEQKTSEFRQAWIDALRLEIASYAVNINAISDKLGVGFRDNAHKVESLSQNYANLNQASFAMKLRLNVKEDRSKAILKAMSDFEELAKSDKTLVPSKIKPIEAAFMEASQTLLKAEWDRVKKGELWFRATRFAALIILVTVITVACSLGVVRPSTEQPTSAPRLGKGLIVTCKGDNAAITYAPSPTGAVMSCRTARNAGEATLSIDRHPVRD